MNKEEAIVKEELERDGWLAFHSGLPDFICFKEGKVKFVEVKSNGSGLTKEQEAVIFLLRAYGFTVEIDKRWRSPKEREYTLLSDQEIMENLRILNRMKASWTQREAVAR